MLNRAINPIIKKGIPIIKDPTTMIALSDKDAAVLARNVSLQYMMTFHRPGRAYWGFVFVDGHATENPMIGGEGWSFESDTVNFSFSHPDPGP